MPIGAPSIAGRAGENRHRARRDVAQRRSIARDRVDAQAGGPAARSARRCRWASRRDRARIRRPRCSADRAPSASWRSLPSRPKTASAPSGAADLHGAEHEALRRIGAVDPDRRVVGIAAAVYRCARDRLDGCAIARRPATARGRRAERRRPAPSDGDAAATTASRCESHQNSTLMPKSIHQW